MCSFYNIYGKASQKSKSKEKTGIFFINQQNFYGTATEFLRYSINFLPFLIEKISEEFDLFGIYQVSWNWKGSIVSWKKYLTLVYT